MVQDFIIDTLSNSIDCLFINSCPYFHYFQAAYFKIYVIISLKSFFKIVQIIEIENVFD